MSLSVPNYQLPAFPLMLSIGKESLGVTIGSTANILLASAAWATANQARYVPFWVPEPLTIVKLLAYNGATAGGNTDIGLYDAAGNEVVGTAAALQAGTTAWQEFDITDTPIRPGLYFIGLLNTTTTGTYYAWATKELGRAAGVYSQAVGAGNLPATATFAALDAAVVPLVGMSTRVLI